MPQNIRTFLLIFILMLTFSPLALASQPHPLSLDEAIAYSINNNYDLFIAKLKKKIDWTSLRQDLGKYDTVMTANAGYRHDSNETTSSVFPTRTYTGNYSVGLSKSFASGTTTSLSLDHERVSTPSSLLASSTNPYYESVLTLEVNQPLLNNSFGFLDRATTKLIKIDIANADLTTLQILENVIAETIHSYYNLFFAVAFVQSRAEAVEYAKQFLEINEEQLNTGLVEEPDYLAAKANYVQRERDLLEAKDHLQNASHHLKFVMNFYPDEDLLPKEISSVGSNNTLEEAIRIAIENRRDYLTKQNELEAADIQIKMKKQNKWPELDLVGSFISNGIDSDSENTFGEVLSKDDNEYFIGATFSKTLFDRTASSQLEKQKLIKQSALFELQKIEKKIALEIDESFRRIELKKRQFEKSQEIKQLQREKFLGEQEKFEKGRSSSDLIIRYQNDLIEASIQEKQDWVDWQQAIIQLKQDQNILIENYTDIIWDQSSTNN